MCIARSIWKRISKYATCFARYNIGHWIHLQPEVVHLTDRFKFQFSKGKEKLAPAVDLQMSKEYKIWEQVPHISMQSSHLYIPHSMEGLDRNEMPVYREQQPISVNTHETLSNAKHLLLRNRGDVLIYKSSKIQL
jgi:hypothetical protein